MRNPELERRYARTLAFIRHSLPPPARILDIGAANAFTHTLEAEGYAVRNTTGDLDLNPGIPREPVDAAGAFEILEHLVSPFPLLRSLEAPRLFATVPLRLWFQTAYRNPGDAWDRHYHEFEDWQFDWLLEKAGWTIVRRDKWTAPVRRHGFRPFLRRFTPRYYAVEAVRPSR